MPSLFVVLGKLDSLLRSRADDTADPLLHSPHTIGACGSGVILVKSAELELGGLPNGILVE